MNYHLRFVLYLQLQNTQESERALHWIDTESEVQESDMA